MSRVGTDTSAKAPEPVALAAYRLKAARTGMRLPEVVAVLGQDRRHRLEVLEQRGQLRAG